MSRPRRRDAGHSRRRRMAHLPHLRIEVPCDLAHRGRESRRSPPEARVAQVQGQRRHGATGVATVLASQRTSV